MNSHYIGRHVSIGNNITNLPKYVKTLGYNFFQIFLSVPQRILSKSKKKEDLLLLSNELTKYNIKMVVHGSYTINFCHDSNNIKYQNSLNSLLQDLESINYIGSNCIGVIIHMGKNITENNMSYQKALNNYIYGIKESLKNSPINTNIILETGASQGTEIANNIEDLFFIYNSLNHNQKKRIFFCIDTCHIWASGYDISNINGVNKYFNEFNNKIGINKIACIHFNDSKTPINSHVDRHADIGYGYINLEGLQEILKIALKNLIPIIMETPLDSINKMTNNEINLKDEYNLINKLIKKLKK